MEWVEKPVAVQVDFTQTSEVNEAPKEFEWTENLHGILHGNKQTMYHGLSNVALGLSKRGGSTAKINKQIITRDHGNQ